MILTHGIGRLELRRSISRAASPWALIFLCAVVPTAASGNASWLTSYEEALSVAEETGKPVLAVFTGSDWCQHCRTLERNVLESHEFSEWAEERVIRLMIDLPQEGISLEERKARSRVCIKYGVRSFPNTVLIAPDGTALAKQAGYHGQTTDAWLASFEDHTPIHTAAAASGKPIVHSSLVKAVESARDSHKPVLVMVSRSGDASATKRLSSLLNDPEFESLANEHFVVAQVPRSASESRTSDEEAVDELLGESGRSVTDLELVVTDDGQTTLFKESCTHETRGVVNGLRRFLAARQGQSARR